MSALHVPDVIELILSFTEDCDRQRAERVSTSFHMACSSLERREFARRIKIEEEIISDEFRNSLRLVNQEQQHVKDPLDEIEEKTNMKIPFHLREYMIVNKFAPSLQLLELPVHFHLLHPFMCMREVSQWKIISRDVVKIGKWKSNHSWIKQWFNVLLKCDDGIGVVYIEKHSDWVYNSVLDEQEQYQVQFCEEVMIGTMKQWLNCFGCFKYRNKISTKVCIETYPNERMYNLEEMIRHGLLLDYFLANYNAGLVKQSLLEHFKKEEYCHLLRKKVISLGQLPRQDNMLIHEAISWNGLNLEFTNREDHNNRELVLQAVRENGLSLKFASRKLRQDPEIISEALKQNPLAKQFSLQKEENSFLETKDFIDTLPENIQRGIYAYGIEHFSSFQQEIISKCQSNPYGNILIEGSCQSGKTIASFVSALVRLEETSAPPSCLQCLVICPTREMARQNLNTFSSLCEYCSGVTAGECVGGHLTFYYGFEYAKSYRVMVGTPGRIMGKIKSGILELSHVKCVIFEGVEELLAGGFDYELETTFRHLPSKFQAILTTSRLTDRLVSRLGKLFSLNPFLLIKGSLKSSIPYHSLELIYQEEKVILIKEIIQKHASGFIFCNSRRNAELLCDNLRQDNSLCSVIHGNLEMVGRDLVVKEARCGRARWIICSDILARGISIHHLDVIVLYDFPENQSIFRERLGRLFPLMSEDKEYVSFVYTKNKAELSKSRIWGKEMNLE